MTSPEQQIKSDLIDFGELTAEQCLCLKNLLEQESGFGRKDELLAAADKSCKVDGKVFEAVLRLLVSVRKDDFLTFLESVSEATDLPPALVEKIRENSKILVQDYVYVSSARKVGDLLRATGNEYFDSRFICDFRPVFSELRDAVLGHVITTTMTVRYRDQAANDKNFELVFSEDELNHHLERLKDALLKVEKLKACRIQGQLSR